VPGQFRDQARVECGVALRRLTVIKTRPPVAPEFWAIHRRAYPGGPDKIVAEVSTVAQRYWPDAPENIRPWFFEIACGAESAPRPAQLNGPHRRVCRRHAAAPSDVAGHWGPRERRFPWTLGRWVRIAPRLSPRATARVG